MSDSIRELEQEIARLDAVVTEREATIESERQAFSETYALQVRRTTDALAVVTAVREIVDHTNAVMDSDLEDPPLPTDPRWALLADLGRALDGVDR